MILAFDAGRRGSPPGNQPRSAIVDGIVKAIDTRAALFAMLVVHATLPLARADERGSWSRLADVPTQRMAAGAAALDGHVYVIGGFVLKDGEVLGLAAVEEYDPAVETWRKRRPMPTGRSFFGIAVAGASIFAIGGTSTDTLQSLDVVEAYDPRTDRWRRVASLPTPRSQVCAATLGGKIYAIGGNAGHERAFEVYDPAADTWAALPPLPRPRRNAAVIASGGKLLVFGGVTPDGWTPVDAFDEYDPATGLWTARVSAPTARTDFAMVAVGGRVVVIGGFRKGPLSVVESNDLAKDEWSVATELPLRLQFPAAVAVDGRIFVAGGTSALPLPSAAFLALDLDDLQGKTTPR